MSREIDNLIYNGEKDGVHNWESISGMHFYQGLLTFHG